MWRHAFTRCAAKDDPRRNPSKTNRPWLIFTRKVWKAQLWTHPVEFNQAFFPDGFFFPQVGQRSHELSTGSPHSTHSDQFCRSRTPSSSSIASPYPMLILAAAPPRPSSSSSPSGPEWVGRVQIRILPIAHAQRGSAHSTT